jgi:hypothetical protein
MMGHIRTVHVAMHFRHSLKYHMHMYSCVEHIHTVYVAVYFRHELQYLLY